MPLFETRSHIDAPVADVWAFISDLEKAPEWIVVMEELVHTSHNPVQEGTTYRERSNVGPADSETEWHVTVCNPEEVQVHECKEPTFTARLTVSLEPAGSGTKLDYRTEYQLMPVFRPLGWLIEKAFAERAMERDLQQTVDNLKRLVEQSR